MSDGPELDLFKRHIAEVIERKRQQAADARALAAAEEEALRAAFRGDCFECLDTGIARNSLHVACRACHRGQALAIQQHKTAVQQAVERADIPPRCRAFSFGGFPLHDVAAVGAVRAFVEDWDGTRGLMLTGAYGVGKTGLVVSALRALFDAEALPLIGGEPALFLTAPDLMDALRRFEDGAAAATLEQVKRVRLLAIDDLGAEKPTEWVQERLFVILNTRYEHERPTFVTTNYGIEDLAARIGARTVERLLETSEVIEVTGPNLRLRRKDAPHGG